ncbi:G-protein-signaling modulator 2-like [Paramacrobiotus metropolitanus]|uniref:G-protein-signaling modulator 2-like n=1 Tax=Paramacrobiotus metropolitanus TaxID=2943436 RepID=UPI002445C492|nr:G-protein-signaling modulator 2-like [Paramacrobiotus metropolitanus]
MTEPDECLSLALKGESLCRAGDFRSGVQAFQAALQIGTQDLSVLSAIYVQLGNAYFYLENYDKALEYHTKDMRIASEMKDTRGEAKASGNIAMTLKSLGQFEAAVACGQRQLELYRAAGDDPVAVSRALYNLGNIHLAKAKAVIGGGGECYEAPPEAREHLDQAVGYYLENYNLVTDFGDLAAQGRVCGNLGSAQYLLGNFPQAVMHHQERLVLARECHDIPAERRAYTNLGNCHIFLGQYALAEQYYLKSLSLVDNARDPALEAQACYSLGNTYSLLNQHEKAIVYYEKHHHIAQALQDRVGEGRACWSLGAAYAALGKKEAALRYATEHYRIAQELGDAVGAAFAQANVQEYTGRMDGQPGSPEDLAARIRRISMEHMDLLRLSPDMAKLSKAPLQALPEEALTPPSTSAPTAAAPHPPHSNGAVPPAEEEDLLDMICRAQSKRLDDQRCSFVANKENHHRMGNGSSKTGTAHAQVRTFEDLMDMIAGVQSKRLDEQRADLPSPLTPVPRERNTSISKSVSIAEETDTVPDEQFFDMLMRVQGARMGDQRATLNFDEMGKRSEPGKE